MTTKDKAEELRDNFGFDKALIAVGYLIREAKDDCTTIGRNQLTDLEFWQEVKIELEKL